MRAGFCVFFLGAALARPAAATPYETFIDIADQADLEDLFAAGDLTQDTYNELLDLLETGVDLSTADRARLYALPNLTYDDVDRIIAVRDQQNGVIRDPAALVPAGALTEDKLLAIAAFLVSAPSGKQRGVHGWVRGTLRFAPRDKLLPPFALRGRATVDEHVEAGFAGVFSRLQIGAPSYDPNRGALIADRRGYGAALPKAFVKYETDDVVLIGGTFRAGFGQRLTFDNSLHYTPNGLYHDDELYYAGELERECRESAGELGASPCTATRYVTPDWRYRDGLLGAGAGWKRLAAGTGWLQLYGWSSTARKSIYQYELVDRGRCPDPHDDSDPACAAPTVFVRPDGSLLTPTSRTAFETLPRVFSEELAGANVTYFADRRNSAGLTIYGAQLTDLVDGVDLDTQEWSRLPTGKRYGAAGANFALGKRWLDVFGEAALSIDRLPDSLGPQDGGGGAAALLRVTATQRRQELEGTLRYYSVDYANPYARPISQPDEFDGQRARDEVGARLRYYTTGKALTVRASLDVWAPVSSLGADSPLGRAQPKLDTYVRADVRTTDNLQLGAWLRFQDKDVRASGHGQCFEVSVETDENGEPIPCGGRQITSTGRVRVRASRTLDVTAMLEHQAVDDGQFTTSPFQDRFRHDLAGWLIALWRPDNQVRIRARARYLHEAINDNVDDYLERSLSTLLDASLGLRARDLLRARVDLKFWLDDRDATLARSPNPELQLWLSYEARL